MFPVGHKIQLNASFSHVHGRFDGYYEPVVVPLSMVMWAHDPVLRLEECVLPDARQWTLGDIGKEVRGDMSVASKAPDGVVLGFSYCSGLCHFVSKHCMHVFEGMPRLH